MSRSKTAALILCGLLSGGLVFAGEDKPKGQSKDQGERQQQAQPSQANDQFDVDGFLRKYDMNKDGFIQRDELPADMRDQFDELDLNKDGKLSREELLRHGEKMARHARHFMFRHQHQPVESVFIIIERAGTHAPSLDRLQRTYDVLRMIDANKDGKIDQEELQAAREKIREHRVDGLLKEFGKDGRISKEQAQGWLRDNFDRLDLNQDGYLDRNELLRACEQDSGANPTTPSTEQPPTKNQEDK